MSAKVGALKMRLQGQEEGTSSTQAPILICDEIALQTQERPPQNECRLVAFTVRRTHPLDPFSGFLFHLPWRVSDLHESEWIPIPHWRLSSEGNLFPSMWPSRPAGSVNRKGHPLIRCQAAKFLRPKCVWPLLRGRGIKIKCYRCEGMTRSMLGL